MSIWLVEYRWSSEPKDRWTFMFTAESFQAVKQQIPEYIYLNSTDWSAFWSNSPYLYARRRTSGNSQTIRVREVDVVPEHHVTAQIA